MDNNNLQEQLNRIERNTLLSAKNVLTFDDVALLTGYSKSHLYKLTCCGKIPHYKPAGKRLFFDKKELEDWLRQNRSASESEIEEMADNYLMNGRV
ncbi:MAG: DNA-binding protein [Bacteroidia bacterium 44-10]|nr:MAG: DNA-binding protein [Bacteroidia bacterium 44-10]